MQSSAEEIVSDSEESSREGERRDLPLQKAAGSVRRETGRTPNCLNLCERKEKD